jgi:UDP-2,4-diacetamido-2,4,6-trideoxy-beta-L-altropyranose hydrolase
MTYRIAFRVDSSMVIGSGHLFRCLALADAFCRRDASVFFICAELPGNLIKYLERKGHVVRRFPLPSGGHNGMSSSPQPHWSGIDWEKDAKNTLEVLAGMPKLSWLVTDHYALDKRWEGQMRPFTEKIMIIDDLADCPHDCDLLLNQNLNEGLEHRYGRLVPDQCVLRIGPRFALLRPEFAAARKILRRRDGLVRRILVFFGGSDPANETSKALEAIRRLNRSDIAADVVVGASNPGGDRIREICKGIPNTDFHLQIENMAELMAAADLAIGAVGTATWERCYLGLPAVTLVLAENQFPIAVQVSKAGAITNLGWHSEVEVDHIAATVRRLLDDPIELREMGSRGIELMGGESFEGTDGVVREMMGNGRAPA